jgi:hypothetical protein
VDEDDLTLNRAAQAMSRALLKMVGSSGSW